MGLNMDRIINLGEKIYFLTYGRPRYKADISEILYGRESKAIYPEIKKLEKNKWIEKLDMRDALTKIGELNCVELEKDMQKMDGRGQKRQYYYAKVQPMFENICEFLKKLGITFNSEEEKKLIGFLDSKWFRYSINQMTSFNVKQYKAQQGFLIIRAELSYLCMFRYYFEKLMRSIHPNVSETNHEGFMDLLTVCIEDDKGIPFSKKIDAEVIKLGLPLQEKLMHLDWYVTITFIRYANLLLEYVKSVYDLTYDLTIFNNKEGD